MKKLTGAKPKPAKDLTRKKVDALWMAGQAYGKEISNLSEHITAQDIAITNMKGRMDEIVKAMEVMEKLLKNLYQLTGKKQDRG